MASARVDVQHLKRLNHEEHEVHEGVLFSGFRELSPETPKKEHHLCNLRNLRMKLFLRVFRDSLWVFRKTVANTPLQPVYTRDVSLLNGGRMKISFASESLQGRREENQDAAWGKVYRRPNGCLRAVAALADGMGGLRGGKRAAELALDTIRDATKDPPARDSELVPWAKALFDSAHGRISTEGRERESLRGMGTTLVLVLVGEEEIVVAHAGDSRCYRVTAGGAEQVTRDHTVLQEAIDRGLGEKGSIQPTSEYRSLASTLVRGLGAGAGADPDTTSFPVNEGEIFFLCSDGLTGSIVDPLVALETLPDELRQHKQLGPALSRLAKMAYEQGSADNITAAALEMGKFPRDI
jgi:protein phosphatase